MKEQRIYKIIIIKLLYVSLLVALVRKFEWTGNCYSAEYMTTVGGRVNSFGQRHIYYACPILILPEFSCMSRVQQINLLSFSFLCKGFGSKPLPAFYFFLLFRQ